MRWDVCHIFFTAKGGNGEDIFDPPLLKRDGNFKRFVLSIFLLVFSLYYCNIYHTVLRGE